MKKSLIIAGMHRSGTSLTASILKHAGLFIGERLLGETKGNVKGHFENEDFLEFHRDVLEMTNLHPDGWDLQQIPYLPQFASRAMALVEKNQRGEWGWKDPRTTLFLDFWNHVLPGSFYFLVYRSPWEVVDSLFRRQTDKIFVHEPMAALSAWKFYNQCILSFYENNCDRCLLVNINHLIADPAAILHALNKRFDFSFQCEVAPLYDDEIYNENHIHPEVLESLVTFLAPDARDLLHTLELRADFPSGRHNMSLESEEPKNVKDLVCKLWYEYNRISIERSKSVVKSGVA